jgi:hypothetical protein
MAETLCEDVHRLLISPYVGKVASQRPLSSDDDTAHRRAW